MKPASEGTKLFYFVVYSILYETLIWGLFLYLIVIMGWSEWTIIPAIIMSASQIQPRGFNIGREKPPEKLSEREFKQYVETKKLEIELEEAKRWNTK